MYIHVACNSQLFTLTVLMLYHMSTQLIDTRTERYGLPLSNGRHLSIMTWIMFITNDVTLSVSMIYDPEGLLHVILLSG